MNVRTSWWVGLVVWAGVASAQPAEHEVAQIEVVQIEVAGGEVGVDQLLEAWSEVTGQVAVMDPQIQSIRVRLMRDTVFDRETLRVVLDAYDVVLVEGEEGTLRAHHRRNLAQRETPPWRVVERDAIPARSELVTAVYAVEHGAGAQIFATMRGLMTRDTNRVGNLLYVSGPELLVLVDLSPQVGYYLDVIEQLDVPPVGVERAVRLERADAREARGVLAALFGAREGEPGVGLRVVADERLNQVLLSGRSDVVERAAAVLATLDADAGEPEPEQVRVQLFQVARAVWRSLEGSSAERAAGLAGAEGVASLLEASVSVVGGWSVSGQGEARLQVQGTRVLRSGASDLCELNLYVQGPDGQVSLTASFALERLGEGGVALEAGFGEEEVLVLRLSAE